MFLLARLTSLAAPHTWRACPQVHFSVFSVRDASRKQAAWRERGAAFDVGAFEREALRLALPRQAFTFSHTRLDLLDDPQLAAAFSLSLRSAFAQVPNAAPARRQFDPRKSALSAEQSRALVAVVD